MKKKNPIILEYKKQKEKAEKNRIFIRKGECSRCGYCCWTFKGRPSIETRVEPCEHLLFDKNGLAFCNIYHNRHESCRDFPLVRYSEHDSKYYKNCTYYWELDTNLSKEEALSRHIKTCEMCSLSNEIKENCENKIKVRKEIEEKLK